MKRLFVLGLCIAFALASPYREQERDRYEQEQDQEQEQYEQYQRREREIEQYERDDDQQEQYDRDEDQQLRYNSYGPLSSSVDLLAKELNYLAAKYGNQGVLKVSYTPPVNQRSADTVVHDLGHLNLKYYSPNAYKAAIAPQAALATNQAPSILAKNKRNQRHKYIGQALNLPEGKTAGQLNLNRVHHLEEFHHSLHDPKLHYHYESQPLNFANAYGLTLRNQDDDDDDEDQQKKR